MPATLSPFVGSFGSLCLSWTVAGSCDKLLGAHLTKNASPLRYAVACRSLLTYCSNLVDRFARAKHSSAHFGVDPFNTLISLWHH